MQKGIFFTLLFLVSLGLNESLYCTNPEPEPKTYKAIICNPYKEKNITQISKDLQVVRNKQNSNFSFSQGEFEALVYYMSNTSSLIENKEIDQNLTNEVSPLQTENLRLYVY